MLEWMIVIGGVCGGIGAFGAVMIGLDALWHVRGITRRPRLPPARAIAGVRPPRQERSI